MKAKKTDRELLEEKCAREFRAFCAHLPWTSRKEMIEKASEIVSRQDILTTISDYEFCDSTNDLLLNQENTMDYLYARYLEADNLSQSDRIAEMIEDIV